MKIIYLIAGTCHSGGMERVLANKANWLVRNTPAQVMIVTTDQHGLRPFFNLDPRIRCTDLDIGYEDNNGGSFIDKLVHYPGKQRKHRRRLTAQLMAERADVVVSMFCNDASFLTKINDGSRKILEIHFSRYKRLQYGRGGLWAVADRLRSINDKRVARRFDRFVVLTGEDRGYWEAGWPMPNICVIPNARTFRPVAADAINNNSHTVLAVGRYNVQKAFDRLIDIWALIQDKPAAEGWTLRIVGDGELRQELQAQIDRLSLGGSIVLGGAEKDMRSVYQSAGIYAMTSLYEGLPMVLLEAQASGLPIVSMACKCGPRDVVTDGVDGFLVPEGDTAAMADRLLTLMADDGLRAAMSAAALAASDRFDEERVMCMWRELFKL